MFSWPGLGSLYLYALGLRADTEIGRIDTPILISLTVVYAMRFVVTIFALDLVDGLLDPRVRASGRQ